MVEQKYIGLVTMVSSGSVSIMIDPKIDNLKRDINGKTYYIGQIGTYVFIPMGNLVLLGMVSELKKTELSINGESQQRFMMTVSMVGTVKGGRYERGVSIFPVVDMPVYLAEDADLAIAFAVFQRNIVIIVKRLKKGDGVSSRRGCARGSHAAVVHKSGLSGREGSGGLVAGGLVGAKRTPGKDRRV